MSDTGAYTDTIFGIFHLLGYQFSPRLADIGGTRFWRVDGKADYGALDELAAQRTNVKLIIQHWEDLLRLVGSLKLGTVQAAGLIRTLQTKDRPTKLARALEELGRLIKTLYLLRFIDDEAYRRRILVQLNRGEGRHQRFANDARSPTGSRRQPGSQQRPAPCPPLTTDGAGRDAGGRLRMVQRRAAAVVTRIGCHSWRPRDTTAYLENGGLLERAQQMAAHSSARTTSCMIGGVRTFRSIK